jgi:F-type H+-transporting ATPase subunit delta
MKINAKQYARSLFELTADLKEDEVTKVIERFILVLKNHRNINQAEAIIDELSLLLQKDSGEIKAELASARALPSEAKQLISSYLEDKIEVTKINWQEKIDQSLLGGFILRYRGFVIDGSVKNNLRKFKKQLLIK